MFWLIDVRDDTNFAKKFPTNYYIYLDLIDVA